VAEPALADVVPRFAGIRVLVIGDVILDSWLHGPSYRLSREGPVPAVTVSATDHQPGGAGNAAANLAALGARVDLLGLAGADADAEALRSALRQAGVDPGSLVTDPGRQTTTKRRLLAADRLVARFDQADPGPVPAELTGELADRAVDLAAAADALLVCDYGGGIFAGPVRDAVGRGAARLSGPSVVDAHDLGPWAALAADAVTPSWEEACRLIGPAGDLSGPDRAAAVVRNAPALLQATGARLVATTLDTDGSVLLSHHDSPHRTYAVPQPADHAAGAGDSYAAAFILALAAGAGPAQAADLGQAAATVAARGTGTVVCTGAELRAAVTGPPGALVGTEELARLVGAHRAAGRRIVFTNGCFDVLHRGHVAYLEQASRLGDVLVVALNSDASVARLKGPGRPVNPVQDRAAVLVALTAVDHVVVFDEASPRRLLDLVRPDVYVKGGDYRPEMIPEAGQVGRLGGEVRVLDYVADHSTSAIIDRIRQS
jgi:rfaE bifunctional protein nucleotidyltransferase chain/domain/rfaE bifunctional protein kinase chain/domain